MHIRNKQKFLELQVDSNQRGVGVKYVEKYADVLCGRPLTQWNVVVLFNIK